MDKDFIRSVGNRIARYRKLQELTQTELGALIGTSNKVIGAWEQGRADPGSGNIILLSKALGVTPNDLLGYEPPGAVQSVVMPDDSMEPQIHKGDVLTVQTDAVPADGDTVVVDTHNDKGIIRKLFRIGAHVMLLSVNPAVPPIGVHNADIRGKVTDIHRKL